MNIPSRFADIETAKQIAHNLYPNTQSITLIEHSHDNIVALVDDTVAVRFPRDANSYLRSLYERHILGKLGSAASVTIPRILSEHFDLPYLVTSFVPGHHVSPATIKTFSKEQQEDFGVSVARFAYTMHTALSLEEELRLRQELGLDELADNEPWPVYYKKVIYGTKFPTAIQDDLAKACYANWSKTCDVTPTVVVHDDLHTENMMFKDNRLVGVLDFGDTSVGTPEQELRQLYRISDGVMQAGIQEYQRLSGRQLDIDAIKLWAIMKELADYSKAYVAQNTGHHSFVRASRNLNTWLPDGEWGKGYDLTKTAGNQ